MDNAVALVRHTIFEALHMKFYVLDIKVREQTYRAEATAGVALVLAAGIWGLGRRSVGHAVQVSSTSNK